MKKLFPKLALLFGGTAAGIVLSFALYAATGGAVFSAVLGGASDSDANTPVSSAGLTDFAYEVLGYIRDRDFAGLSETVHPEFGVVFSPYATVTLASNKCFTAQQISRFGSDDSVYVWGVYDALGTPIELTPSEYFARFVFDRDFTQAPVIGVNHIIRSGNALENISETFPNVQFVEFHFPDSGNESSEELDWKSLRLGFEEYKGGLKLTLILHSEWTI